MKKSIHSDIFIGIGIEAICAFFYFYGKKLPDAAQTFPNILLFLIAFLSIFIIIEGFKKTKEMNGGKSIKDLSWNEIRYPLLCLLMSVVYYILFRYAGYFIATPLLLVGMMLFFGVKNWKPLVFIPVGYLIFTYVLFVMQLGVRLI